MHLLPSYRTAPWAVFLIAPPGHVEAQAGSSQCRHIRRTNLSPRVSTAVNAAAPSVGSGSPGWLWAVLHAAEHCWQPMHLVISISIALVSLVIITSPPFRSWVPHPDFS